MECRERGADDLGFVDGALAEARRGGARVSRIQKPTLSPGFRGRYRARPIGRSPAAPAAAVES